jgi:hypothetical protein
MDETIFLSDSYTLLALAPVSETLLHQVSCLPEHGARCGADFLQKGLSSTLGSDCRPNHRRIPCSRVLSMLSRKYMLLMDCAGCITASSLLS